MRLFRRLLLALLSVLALPAFAIDRAILDAPANEIDKRNDYSNLLLTEILKKTSKKYGGFSVEYAPEYMQRDRLLAELKKGALVNVTAKATRPDWEDSELNIVRIPVDKGITEYRMFLIHRDDQDKFHKINTLDELRQLNLGVGLAWSTKGVFQAQNFRIEAVSDWESMYKMLINRRFDYFPRALSEIFVEYDDRHETYPELAIEDSIVLYFPLPKYFFVSPLEPRLAQRIEEGFHAMLADGSFNKFFIDYHKPLIDRANFCKRRLFRFSNPLLSAQTPLGQSDYWYDPYNQRVGGKLKPVCNK